jgi:1-acyl-sn-glycerol-3-phosphate acyltransferase
VLPVQERASGAAEAAAGQWGACEGAAGSPPAFTGLQWPADGGGKTGRFFAWYGDMEMVPHLWEALLAGPLDVVVQFHEPLSLDDGPQDLAARARQIVQSGQAQAWRAA